jgi:hypothetical protein
LSAFNFNEAMKGWGVGEQLFLEHFVWFDNETRLGSYPSAFKLAARFKVRDRPALCRYPRFIRFAF